MELDTGAILSVVSEKTYTSLFSARKVPQLNRRAELKTSKRCTVSQLKSFLGLSYYCKFVLNLCNSIVA